MPVPRNGVTLVEDMVCGGGHTVQRFVNLHGEKRLSHFIQVGRKSACDDK